MSRIPFLLTSGEIVVFLKSIYVNMTIEQSAFHGQASDLAWFFSELLFQSVAAKKQIWQSFSSLFSGLGSLCSRTLRFAALSACLLALDLSATALCVSLVLVPFFSIFSERTRLYNIVTSCLSMYRYFASERERHLSIATESYLSSEAPRPDANDQFSLRKLK